MSTVDLDNLYGDPRDLPDGGSDRDRYFAQLADADRLDSGQLLADATVDLLAE